MNLLRLSALTVLVATGAHAASMSDADVKQAIMRESLESYPGNCPCPYNVDRAGHMCGGRSAYSRPGGYSPICYENQVTPAMIENYRREHRQ